MGLSYDPLSDPGMKLLNPIKNVNEGELHWWLPRTKAGHHDRLLATTSGVRRFSLLAFPELYNDARVR